MKTFKMKFVVFMMIVLCGMLFSGCLPQNQDYYADPIKNMSYQAVSSFKMMEVRNQFMSKSTFTRRLQSDEEVLEKETIEKYLSMMNELLANEGNLSSEEKTSDREEYTHLLEITTKDFDGKEVKYLLYYNEVSTEETTDDDESSISNKIEGIAICEDVEYRLEGKMETETEEDETENESYFKIIEDDENYVVVKEEFEQEQDEYEHQYKYQVVANGKKVNTVTFKLEKEKGETVIKLTEEADSKTTYKFKMEEDNGNTLIKIKVSNGGQEKNILVKVVYNISTQEYEYEYSYND